MQLNKKTFVIFPGRFHPWHNGHKSVYNYLTTKFGGNDVYITTTGVTELPKSPFTFDEKKQMMITTGIPANKILNVKNNYNFFHSKRLLSKILLFLPGNAIVLSMVTTSAPKGSIAFVK